MRKNDLSFTSYPIRFLCCVLRSRRSKIFLRYYRFSTYQKVLCIMPSFEYQTWHKLYSQTQCLVTSILCVCVIMRYFIIRYCLRTVSPAKTVVVFVAPALIPAASWSASGWLIGVGMSMLNLIVHPPGMGNCKIGSQDKRNLFVTQTRGFFDCELITLATEPVTKARRHGTLDSSWVPGVNVWKYCMDRWSWNWTIAWSAHARVDPPAR